MQLHLPLPEGHVLHFNTDVIDDDIPLLLGIDVMRCHGVILDF